MRAVTVAWRCGRDATRAVQNQYPYSKEQGMHHYYIGRQANEAAPFFARISERRAMPGERPD